MKAAFKYLIIWLLINIFATFLVMIAGYIACAIMGHPFPDIETLFDHPWIVSLSLFVDNLLVLFVFWKRKYTRFGINYGYTFGEAFSSRNLYLWTAVAAIGLLIFNVAVEFYLPLPEEPDVMETLMQMMQNPVGILSVCLIGPLAEEVIFRGAIERRLLEKNWNPWFAIVISALFFAVAHFNFAQGFTATIIGIFMGWVYYRTRSIWPTVVIHVVNNTTATIVALASPETMADESYVPPLSVGIPLIIVGLILIFLAAKYIAKLTADRTPIPVPSTEVLPPPLPVEYADQWADTPATPVELDDTASPDNTPEA